MACDILTRLKQLNCLPENYFILEVSADLRERQQQFLQEQQPEFFEKITWLDELPKDFIGAVLANEVIDALPVNLFQWQENQLFEHIIKLNNAGEIDLGLEPAGEDLLAAFEKIKAEININDWQTPYSSEINLLLDGWIKALANCLKQGAILLIDYGQVRKNFYHPQRNKGTLMCHFQHQAHSDPLTLIGLQDITAHVDFTAVADSATEAGLTLEGFCTQASFLLNCGLTELAGKGNQEETINENTAIKKLTHPNEMGEVFKVIGFSRDLDGFLMGFDNNDISKKL
jgi:SAM-dependent MidA family methyltransferase